MDPQGHGTPPPPMGAPAVQYPAGAPYAPYQHIYQQQQQQQNQQLQLFWADQYREIEQTTDFKNHNLPLARIKKIMKADEDVRMISAEAPILFAKACELFILELTIRSWLHAEENKRRTLQKNDIAAAITRTDIFDFLVDIVPREEIKEEGAAAGGMGLMAGTAAAAAAAAGVPYYYPPPAAAAGMMMGQPAMDPMYMQQQQPWQAMWQQQQQQGMGDEAYGAPQGYPATHPAPAQQQHPPGS